MSAGEEHAIVVAARSGDQTAFSTLCEPHRRALRAHCYRLLGSFDEAEDMVQETMMRAWRGREGFEGKSLFRTWLYKIATNVCLNALERAPARVLPQDVAPAVTAATPASEARSRPMLSPELPWLQPYPDDQLDLPAPEGSRPDSQLAARETIELAYIAALQHLPPRQRAILILCDVVGWSAEETAEMLEGTVAAVTSMLQRAHATMRARLPAGRGDWAAHDQISTEQRAVLQKFMAAWERGDPEEVTRLLREDARWAMPPAALWFDGRPAIANMLRLFPPTFQGEFRMVATAANRQPAAAAYLRRAGEPRFSLSAVLVLRVEGAQIAELTTFSAALCRSFELPPVIS